MIQTSVTYIGHPEALKKHLKAGVRAGLEAGEFFWHRKFAQMHFHRGAEGRYGYKHRTHEYKRRKRRVKGHDRPLVWTGDSERQITRSIRVAVSKAASGKRIAKGRFTAPPHFWRYRPGQPHKGEELVTTLDREALAIAKVVSKMIDRHLRRCKERKHRRLF